MNARQAGSPEARASIPRRAPSLLRFLPLSLAVHAAALALSSHLYPHAAELELAGGGGSGGDGLFRVSVSYRSGPSTTAADTEAADEPEATAPVAEVAAEPPAAEREVSVPPAAEPVAEALETLPWNPPAPLRSPDSATSANSGAVADSVTGTAAGGGPATEPASSPNPYPAGDGFVRSGLGQFRDGSLEAIHAPPPAYPAASRRMGEEGTVLCRLTVSADGRVSAVDVVASSGSVRLDQAARDGLLAWRFQPLAGAGRVAPARLEHRVVFRLRG